MSQPVDLKYIILLDEDEFPLDESLTVGRHLDNDIVVAGEDVLDFHLRLEPTPRGPRVIPLGEATAVLNGIDSAEPTGLMIDDQLVVGHELLSIQVIPGALPVVEEWWLNADDSGARYRVAGEMRAGRADDNEIVLVDDHVSRHHANLVLREGVVWLKDLGSANGTYVNGTRITGGCRLFHGDQLAFDELGFQLVGKGAELTDVRRARRDDGVALATPLQPTSGATADTTEVAVIEDCAHIDIPESSEIGAFLLGASEPISGMTFRTRIGRTVIGRDASCDVVVSDTTVSGRHAEIVSRPGSATITNLLATNGTRVNGQQVQSSDLKDGDLVRVGQVHLVYKDVPVAAKDQPWLAKTRWLLLGGSLFLALLLALALV